MGNVENNKAPTSAYEASTTPTGAKATKPKKSREAFESSASANRRPAHGPTDTFGAGTGHLKAASAPGATTHAVGPTPLPTVKSGVPTRPTSVKPHAEASSPAGEEAPKTHAEPATAGEGEGHAEATTAGTVETVTQAPEGMHSLNDDPKVKKSSYKLQALPNGEFRLQHKQDPTRSYVVQIFPSAQIGAGKQKEVGEVIGQLLDLLAYHENTYGGIKSVTFSGNGGQMVFGQHPHGNRPIAFGGDNNLEDVDGKEVGRLLRELEGHLGHCQLELRANRTDPAADAAADDVKTDKKKAEQKQAKPASGSGDAESTREADDAKKSAKAEAAKHHLKK